MDVHLRVVPFGGNTGPRDTRGLQYLEAQELRARLQEAWPADWPVPTVGAVVELPGERIGQLQVRDVAFYPLGDGGDDPAPFVYVVLGGPRLEWS